MNPEIRSLFDVEAGFLNSATVGAPPIASIEAMTQAMTDWRHGTLQPPQFDSQVDRGRAAWASICGIDVSTVAVGLAVSHFVGVVAASLPDGARVVTAEGDFTSVLFPFLAQADRGVTVESVPLERLPETAGGIDLVAVSAVQSADGRLADIEGLLALKDRSGAKLLVDVTQASGWLPLDCSAFDYIVCSAYKWLMCPRGIAFFGVREEHWDDLRPVDAGWYAGDDPWASIYGTPLRLAPDARRFNLSPPWLSWAGAVPALELLAGLDLADVHAHNVGLAGRFLAEVGQASQGSAIVTVDAPGAADKLAAAGIRTAVRAGRVRASFHLYNTGDDALAAAEALRS